MPLDLDIVSAKHTGSKKARSTDYEPGWRRGEEMGRSSCQMLCGRGEEEGRRREEEEV